MLWGFGMGVPWWQIVSHDNVNLPSTIITAFREEGTLIIYVDSTSLVNYPSTLLLTKLLTHLFIPISIYPSTLSQPSLNDYNCISGGSVMAVFFSIVMGSMALGNLHPLNISCQISQLIITVHSLLWAPWP